MSVLDVSPFENEQQLIKSFDSQRKRNMKKVQKYGVELRFLEVDEIDKFVKLYADTSSARASLLTRMQIISQFQKSLRR